jgi:hypothetical protein
MVSWGGGAGTRPASSGLVLSKPAARELVVTFERDGKVRSPGVTLAVPVMKRYRTFAFYSPTRVPVTTAAS